MAWRRRREPGVRFALAWLLPAWALFEAMPTKLAHYPLPLYGAVAWLAAAAMAPPLMAKPLGAKVRWSGAALAALVGVALATGAFYLLSLYGDPSDVVAAAITAALLAAAGLVGGYLIVRRAALGALVTALGLGVAGHAALAAGLAPRLEPLWLSDRTGRAIAKARLLPRQGIAAAPIAVAGYAEPSLVFALGTPTELEGASEAARAIYEHRPAVVEAREDPAFHRALAVYGVRAYVVATVQGLDYSNGNDTTLRVYQARDARLKGPGR